MYIDMRILLNTVLLWLLIKDPTKCIICVSFKSFLEGLSPLDISLILWIQQDMQIFFFQFSEYIFLYMSIFSINELAIEQVNGPMSNRYMEDLIGLFINGLTHLKIIVWSFYVNLQKMFEIIWFPKHYSIPAF